MKTKGMKEDAKKIGIIIGVSSVFLLGAFALLFAAEVIHNPFDSDFKQSHSIAFVIGAHSNSKTINFNSEFLNSKFELLAETYGTLSIVVADGTPTQQATVNPQKEPDPLGKLIAFFSNENNLEQRIERIVNYLSSQKALTPDVNMLEALDTAAKQLNDLPSTDVKEIIVLGTGLSTTGFLNFSENESYLYTDPDQIVMDMVNFKNLPNFNGIKVTWLQMHDVNEPQGVFEGVQRENLERIWRGIIENGGGTLEIRSVAPGNDFYGSESYPDYPPVSIVNVRPREAVVFGVTISPDTASVKKGESFTFSASVDGDNNPSQDVTWEVVDSVSVVKDGELQVALDETKSLLTLKASSVANPSIHGEAHITVGDATVSGVVITPSSLLAKKGAEYQLSSEVLGSLTDTPQDVIWSVLEGNGNTAITQSGLLSIASDESATTLSVTVVSQTNSNVFGTLAVVIIPDDVKVSFYGNQPENEVPYNNGNQYFIGGRDSAIDVIDEWASYIKNQDNGVYLFGCTAKADSSQNENYNSSKQLGQNRADAVKEVLITDFDVDPGKIITIGLGYDNPWHIDNGINGVSWNEAIASDNRRVYIMPIGDVYADSVYNGEWK